MRAKPVVWTREQLLIAFALYCRTPFGKMHRGNPEIIQLASLLGRTPSSLAMKLSNFASLDPAITSTGRAGLKGASAGDRRIWDEFHDDWEALADESNVALAKLSPIAAADSVAPDLEIIFPATYVGETRRVTTEVRVRQAFFRRAVLASYLGKCCMSGIAEPKLLVASHIIPWSEDKTNRLNPRNGLCLSALHDRAFDLGLITVGLDFRVRVSRRIKRQSENPLIQSALCGIEDAFINRAEKFLPEPSFLEWHHKHRFEANQ